MYGPLGFNSAPSLGFSDVLQSAALLDGYFAEEVPAVLPWEDLRCLLGEVMYGGHVGQDRWDLRVVAAYADFLFHDGLLDEADLFPYLDKANGGAPVFHAPTTTASFESLLDHVLDACTDSPLACGLHPDADFACRAHQGEALTADFLTCALLATGGLAAVAGASAAEDAERNGSTAAKPVLPGALATRAAVAAGAELVAQDVWERFVANGRRGVDCELAAKGCEVQGAGPFQALFLNESARLNRLLGVIAQSLEELDRGFKGELSMSEAMDATERALFQRQVPGPWRCAYPSRRAIATWGDDLHRRLEQMETWAKKPAVLPVATWISGLLNPAAFLTAVLQAYAHENAIDLDALQIFTEASLFSLCSLAQEGSFSGRRFVVTA
jgi:dynein heavy chain